MARLLGAGFERDAPSVVLWLGVLPYLTRAAILGTLRTVGGLPDTRLVFDYPEPPGEEPDPERARRKAAVAALGEPWISFFRPDELAALLQSAGFTEISDLGLDGFGPRYLGMPAGTTARGSGHIVCAATGASENP